ncbi:EAL domain-containing protein [Alkalicoccus urumqiensis]|uniref:EAL domain-containing protein n=1 Tax=Alkalicoccus urumqiensis TaxID=1548213 RepID=A0A2P6MF05_ALKUR|nr:EAL domain-containing protein [Alkalicoccus urumqiensis]PRO64866.1 EAL domain-containing protein [Alkalicoccus urumqiensis]
MESCQMCQGKIPLSETGQLILASGRTEILKEVQRAFKRSSPEANSQGTRLYIPYKDWDELHEHMNRLNQTVEKEEIQRIRGSLIDEHGSRHMPGNSFTMPELSEQIDHPEMVKIIQERLFQSFMQPVIDARTDEPFGYEFLLRPNSKVYPFNPGELFAFSQNSGLQSMLDSQARINAIRTSSHRLMPGMKRFINFLPSSIYDPSHCLKSTFKAVKDYNVNPEDLVFEVVETEKITDIAHLKYIFSEYKKAGVMVALDDVGTGFSTIEVLKELQPNYAKLDRSLIQDIHLHPEKAEKLKEYREAAASQNIKLLAEGIELPEEYNIVKPLVDYVQGYYFGKPMIKPA